MSKTVIPKVWEILKSLRAFLLGGFATPVAESSGSRGYR